MDKKHDLRFPAATIFMIWECLFLLFSFRFTPSFSLHILSSILIAVLLSKKHYSPFLAAAITLRTIAIMISPSAFLSLLSAILLSAFSIIIMFPVNEKIKLTVKKLWFIPGIFSLFTIIGIIFFPSLAYGFFDRSFQVLIRGLIHIFFTFSLCKWIANPEKSEESSFRDETRETADSKAYFGLFPHILLLILSFGIWQSIWIYRTTKYLNFAPGYKHRSPGLCLLFYWFLPFYFFYWYYNAGRRVEAISLERKVPCKIAGLCLFLSIFFGFIPPIIIQEKINCIARAVQMKNQFSQAPREISDTEKLRNFKDLLDSGVITQEEFDQKKKQILGL